MGAANLSLTPQERDFLVELLTSSLKGVKIEEHRTRTLSFRELVTHERELLEGILNKLTASDVLESPTNVLAG